MSVYAYEYWREKQMRRVPWALTVCFSNIKTHPKDPSKRTLCPSGTFWRPSYRKLRPSNCKTSKCTIFDRATIPFRFRASSRNTLVYSVNSSGISSAAASRNLACPRVAITFLYDLIIYIYNHINKS